MGQMLRLGSDFPLDELVAMSHQYYEFDGSLDPIEVAQREIAARAPDDD